MTRTVVCYMLSQPAAIQSLNFLDSWTKSVWRCCKKISFLLTLSVSFTTASKATWIVLLRMVRFKSPVASETLSGKRALFFFVVYSSRLDFTVLRKGQLMIFGLGSEEDMIFFFFNIIFFKFLSNSVNTFSLRSDIVKPRSHVCQVEDQVGGQATSWVL